MCHLSAYNWKIEIGVVESLLLTEQRLIHIGWL